MAGGATHIDDSALVVTDAMIAVDHALTHLPAKSAVQLIEFCRRRLDATEARLLADRYDKGASDRDVEDLIRDQNNTSKAEAKKRARRAKATNANPDIADRMASGKLSSEQADNIADAAEETDGEAACDEDFIEDIAASNPEQGKKKAKTYINKRKSKTKAETVRAGQLRRRTVYRYRTKQGDHVLAIQGDQHTIDQLENQINASAEEEYDADGGRDVPRHKHPRTNDQRRFDAAAKLLGADTSTNTKTAGKKPVSGAAAKPSDRRTTMFVRATVDQLTGVDDSMITSCDGKPLPQSVLDEIACGTDFIAQIFSATGDLLWQGRKVRYATKAQINGLVSRDGGCVLCNAPHQRCVAHHLDPFEAPIKGQTNIDRLALVCPDCHTRLHRNKQTLYYEPKTKAWKLRAARWEEIPPDKPNPNKPRLDETRRNRRRNDQHGHKVTNPLF